MLVVQSRYKTGDLYLFIRKLFMFLLFSPALILIFIKEIMIGCSTFQKAR